MIKVRFLTFLMKNVLYTLKKGMISLSTPGTKGANCFTQIWNKSHLGISLCYFSSSVPSGASSPILHNLSIEFIEWFRGFTDAEGCFLIAQTGNHFGFRFIIKLHVDDLTLLKFIQNSLGGIGSVIMDGSAAYFKVTSRSDLNLIIEIFSTEEYSLNSSKHLNFLAFRDAYMLYISSKNKTPELAKEILTIKSTMNSKRSDTEAARLLCEKSHKVRITDHWLLGFIEGDGSFSITKADFILTFSISQKGNLVLMEAIRSYLFNLKDRGSWGSLTPEIKVPVSDRNVIYLTKTKSKASPSYTYVLIVKSRQYVNNVLIPYFDSLTFHSKKKLDYLDWKSIGLLKSKGLHYLSEGKELIELILSQMNNNRLSDSGNSVVDRDYIKSEIARLLNGPSNYETIKGKIFIKSLNKYQSLSFLEKKTKVVLRDLEGLEFQTFESMNRCAEFLGVSTHTVSKRKRTNSPIIFNNKEYYIT